MARQQRIRPRQNCARGQREHGNQSVPRAAWVSRVGHLGQLLQQAGDLVGYDLRMLADLIKGRRDHRDASAATVFHSDHWAWRTP